MTNDNIASLFDIVPTALLVVDNDCLITIWNAEMEAITGFLAKDVMHKSIKIVLPGLAYFCKDVFLFDQETRFQKRLEAEIQHRDGHTIPIGFSISRLTSKDSIPSGAIVIASDISERVRGEKLIQALTNAGRKAALAHTPEQVFAAMSDELSELNIWSLVTKLDNAGENLRLRHIDLRLSLSAANLNFKPEEELLAEELMQASAPVARTPYFLEMCKTEQTIFVKEYWSTKAGTTFPSFVAKFLKKLPFPRGADVIMAPLWEDRKIVGLLLVGGEIRADDVVPIGAFANQLSQLLANVDLWQNMEEQIVQRSEKLYQEQIRLNVILRHMTDAVIFTDAQECIQYVNPAWEKLNGYTLDEVLGKKSSIVTSTDTPEAIRHAMAQAVSHGLHFEGELVNRRKDGSTYEVYLAIVPVRDDKKNLQYFVGVLRDISTEKRLARAQDKFIAEMSHELRTPLTNIQLYLSLLEKGNSESYKKYMDTVKRESKRLHRLIESLLSISRHDHDRFNFTPATVNLNEFLQRLVEDRAELAQKDAITLEFAPMQDLPLVTLAPSLLEEATANLLTNAINYSKSGGTILVAPCQQKHDGFDWVGFSVSDTGYGITEDELPLIFDRFFRGSASQISKATGTGLGLSLCKQIIDRHDGRIDVKSKLNEGSVFTIWLRA